MYLCFVQSPFSFGIKPKVIIYLLGLSKLLPFLELRALRSKLEVFCLPSRPPHRIKGKSLLSDPGKVNPDAEKPGPMVPLPAVKENEPVVVILNCPGSSSSISFPRSLYDYHSPWFYWPCGWNVITLTLPVLEWPFGKNTAVQVSGR